jgi:hypothetical protein
MQESTEDDEASTSTENVRDGPNLNHAVAVRRKAAKRTLPWDLAAQELLLIPSSSLPRAEASPQAEDITTAKKKPRLEEPLPTTPNEAARKTASPDVSVGLPPPVADDDDTNTNVDPMTDTQPNAGATSNWTLEEDAKLTSAVTNTSKKKWGKKYKADWPTISELIPGRTKNQCYSRWHNILDPSIDRLSQRTGKWSEDENIKLKDAVQTHGDKDWGAIAALVPGRTKSQCSSRWKKSIDPNRSTVKDWAAITALVSDRTQYQCRHRWRTAFDPSIVRSSGRKGKWTSVEDSKLKDAVQTHGGKNWGVIGALVPGRTNGQCRQRWYDALYPSIDRATARASKWTADEDKKLMDSVQLHGDKGWAAIAALVPGRTKIQCRGRWHYTLDQDRWHPSIDGANRRTSSWTEDEDSKLKDAVQTHGGKNWCAVAALVPGRTEKQCLYRWKYVLDFNIAGLLDVLDPSIDRANERTGTWTEDEDNKLKGAVQTHGGKNWCAVAALVPGRTQEQCLYRWKYVLDFNIAELMDARVNGQKTKTSS